MKIILSICLLLGVMATGGCSSPPETPEAPPPTASAPPPAKAKTKPDHRPMPDTEAIGDDTVVRVAVFNIWELSREKLDTVDWRDRGTHPQLRGAAEILQRTRPDVVLIKEIDWDPEEQTNARLFVERYLQVPQREQEAIDYPYIFFGPVNTGFPTGLDMNRNGDDSDPEDAFGFGHFPGQFGMAILSRFPFDTSGLRTFQNLLWRDQPDNLMPDGQDGKPAFYGPDQVEIFRLSSKSHWDVPVRIGKQTLHLLASHPTPTVFDEDEDRNGRRCFDEIRLWADYLTGGASAEYLVDDEGYSGGLRDDAKFVILGDLNADPVTDEAPYGPTAISQLLEHPRVQDPDPRASGGFSEEREYPGDKDTRTSSWGRIDYALPSRDLYVESSGIFWPDPDDPLHRLVANEEASSDHRLVWVDVILVD